jgi:hypothetical protein
MTALNHPDPISLLSPYSETIQSLAGVRDERSSCCPLTVIKCCRYVATQPCRYIDK